MNTNQSDARNQLEGVSPGAVLAWLAVADLAVYPAPAGVKVARSDGGEVPVGVRLMVERMGAELKQEIRKPRSKLASVYELRRVTLTVRQMEAEQRRAPSAATLADSTPGRTA